MFQEVAEEDAACLVVVEHMSEVVVKEMKRSYDVRERECKKSEHGSAALHKGLWPREAHLAQPDTSCPSRDNNVCGGDDWWSVLVK